MWLLLMQKVGCNYMCVSYEQAAANMKMSLKSHPNHVSTILTVMIIIFLINFLYRLGAPLASGYCLRPPVSHTPAHTNTITLNHNKSNLN